MTSDQGIEVRRAHSPKSAASGAAFFVTVPGVKIECVASPPILEAHWLDTRRIHKYVRKKTGACYASAIRISMNFIPKGGSNVLMSRVALALGLLIGAVGSWAQIARLPDPQVTAPLAPLLEALANGGVSGSLELSRCAVGPFPKLQSASASQGSLLQAVREMFASDSVIQITQDADGTIRMIERGAQTDLLNVRIGSISFEINGLPRQSAFNPTTVLAELLQSSEIISFMKTHQMNLVIRPQGSLLHDPYTDNSPHIAESMQDVTLSQALDRVLKTFPGIWVYENCPQTEGEGRSVFLMFLNLQHPGLVEEPGKGGGWRTHSNF